MNEDLEEDVNVNVTVTTKQKPIQEDRGPKLLTEADPILRVTRQRRAGGTNPRQDTL